MTESQVAEQIMIAFPKMSKLIKAKDQFSYFDYENKRYLFEIKSRRKAYDPWIIEELKIDTNIGIAESIKKDFVYVNEFEGVIYIWNISKLIRDDYNFGFHNREMPWHTDFEGNQTVNKMTGYLYNKDALVINTEPITS
tara:strand:+ start:349 stop:765 length:417 start_codon:yes stop_codon:yes gene_type:complete